MKCKFYLIILVSFLLASCTEEVKNVSANGWKEITYDAPIPENVQVVECFASQFKFTFRFPGRDDSLSMVDHKLYSIDNPLGIFKDSLTNHETRFESDDIIIDQDLHLVVNRPVTFKFRSKDVIHSAYFPHFRAQMNCVPGQPTEFTYTPIYTTEEFSKLPEVQEKYMDIKREAVDSTLIYQSNPFNYMLICNKICGNGHFQMNRKIIVETELEFEKWYECSDWYLESPITPRLDVDGNPVIYNLWESDQAVGYNLTNLVLTK